MQVLMGPTYNVDVSVSASSSSPACVRDRSSSGGVSASSASASAAAQDSNKCNEKAGSSSCLFLMNGGDGDEDENDIVGDPIRRTYGSDELSDSSSSIGAPGDSEEEEEEEEDGVVSSSKEKDGVGGLTRNKFSMSSLEDSLLNKRGLSNHYGGKSKSFGNLAEVVETSGGAAKQVLEKEENPFNKRRRILIANRLSRKLFYSTPTHRNRKSMPLLPVLHDDDDEEETEGGGGGGDIYKHQQQRHDDDDEHQLQQQQQQYQYGSRLKLMINNSMRYKSHSCFCLADLGEEEEEEEQQQED